MQTAPFNHKKVIFFLGVLNALTPFTIDLYLPAFGDIALDLNTTVARVSLSVATYFVGYALGQLIYGPLLDRFGRKKPVYIGLFIYLLATVGCMTSQNIESLLFFRFLTALGGSAASVATVAMVRDYFDPKEGTKVFSYLMLVLSTSPLFAPTIGGWIAQHHGWRLVFGFLVVMALVDIVLLYMLPRNYEGNKNVSLKPRALYRGFREVFMVSIFRKYSFAGAFSFAGLFVYITGSPAIFIDGYGFSKAEYSYIFALLACAMIAGGQINNQLLKKFASQKIYETMITLQMLTGIIFLGSVMSAPLTAPVTIAFIFILLMTVGLAYPNAAAMAMAPFGHNAGTASALLGFIQMSVGAVLAAVVGMMDVSGTFPTALAMSTSAIIAWIILKLTQTKPMV